LFETAKNQDSQKLIVKINNSVILKVNIKDPIQAHESFHQKIKNLHLRKHHENMQDPPAVWGT